jgi:cytochrome c553
MAEKRFALLQRYAPMLGVGLLAAGIWSTSISAPIHSAKKIEFNRDIRPIITKCFTCHGHDPKQIMAGLRLDHRDSATSRLKDGKIAIVPGHPEQSEMIRRIYAKGDDQMPPLSSNKFLNDDERKMLADWITEGAEYKEHWAFVAPVRPGPPIVREKAWPRNPIDNFILAKIEDNGLKPSPEADKPTLIRRVTLDLTGIPPTPAEVTDYLNDHSPNAYEKVVDRLLASPRYGERMAMDWMDYSRYADSNGYQADYERYQWRWRDWVINAFNKNMPYDEFTIEQLAGDLLPHPTLDQIIATGFNRNHRINTEGGVIAEEWRVETVIDRVETTSETWLGLTAGCARCHDHKYDPISQKDFYSLCSYFNNVPESGTGVEIPVNHPPLVKAPNHDQVVELQAYDQEIAALQKKLEAHTHEPADDWTVPAPVPISTDGLVARYKLGDSPSATAGSVPQPKVVGTIEANVGRSTGSVITSDSGYVSLGDIGDFERNQNFSWGAWVFPNDDGYGTVFSRMKSDQKYRGWDFSIQNRQVDVHLIHDWPMDAIKVHSVAQIPAKAWSHVFVSYDGTNKASGVRIYIDGRQVQTMVDNDHLTDSIRVKAEARIGRRVDSDFYNGRVDDPILYSRKISDDEAKNIASVHPAAVLLAIPKAKRAISQREQLSHLWSYEHDPEYKSAYDDIGMVNREKDALNSKITTVMVMSEMERPRNAYVLIRGQYNKHGDQVTAAVPASLPPLPKGVPNNRLGLAKWIVSPTNPLTARVTVNRMWERLFGTGIVATIEDFGTRAEFPSHPELLDWLATEFVRLKWDQKAMWKEMVMSATYRQSSAVSPALLKIDSGNRLLARGPRFRLPGEVIRDQALAASGLLVEKIGGPSVRPYQPDGIWDEVNVYGNLRNYMHDNDSGLHRRSLYTIWKRTAAPPNMTLFDVPSRETCRVVRARTDTPLQALDLLNDVTYLEASRALAQRMIKFGGSSASSRIDYGFSSLLGRMPTQRETAIIDASLAHRLALYRAHPDQAKKLISQGDLANDSHLNPAEIAAYTVTASTLLNLDETVTKE